MPTAVHLELYQGPIPAPLAVIFGILAIFEIGVPCLLDALVDLGIVGAVSTILTWILLAIGCQWQVGETFPV